jgi:hypothetical protein
VLRIAPNLRIDAVDRDSATRLKIGQQHFDLVGCHCLLRQNNIDLIKSRAAAFSGNFQKGGVLGIYWGQQQGNLWWFVGRRAPPADATARRPVVLRQAASLSLLHQKFDARHRFRNVQRGS